MPVTTDYTSEATTNTMAPGAMQPYRALHWLRGVLQNFMTDPINIKDERLCGLLKMQDGMSDTQLNALFSVGGPYSQNTKKAGITPQILVGLGTTTYPIRPINDFVGTAQVSQFVNNPHGAAYRTIEMTVTVVTESYDGTILLCGFIEDFLLLNAQLLAADSRILSTLNVAGTSAPQEITAEQVKNAKPIYQQVIGLKATGGLSWTTDTQGPVFRGIHLSQKLI